MSISKFPLSYITQDLTQFYNFLNTNKAGTFLDNMTIELVSNNELTITSANQTTITFYTNNSSAGITFEGNITSSIKPENRSASGNNPASFGSCLLCNNGLIVNAGADIYGTQYYGAQVAITVDSTGDLAVIFRNSALLVNSGENTPIGINGYRVIAADSVVESVISLWTQYEAQKTSLAPIVPICNDNSISLPYAYAALHTQAIGVGLQAMRMNGSNYITNGVWYIKDGE